MRCFIIFPMFVLPLQAEVSRWTHFTIDNPMPGSGWGTAGPALGDFDGDGDLDIALSRRTTLSAFWYEREDDSTWIPHIMGSAETLHRALGNVTMETSISLAKFGTRMGKPITRIFGVTIIKERNLC